MSDPVTSSFSPWYQRWWLYLWEMFQPGSRLLFSVFTVLGLSFALQTLSHQALQISGRFFLATASLMLILLYYRLCDEFKDLETDRLHFPERPVPSGRVLLKDLRLLQGGASLLGLLLNLIWPQALGAYLALYAFAWGMGKWFFLPELIGNNRLLAFLTHSPISLFGSFYVMALYLPPDQPLLTWPHLLLALWFGLPGFSWEVARKTRAPANEEKGYQIYSSQLGHRLAAALPPLFTFGQLGVLFALASPLRLPGWFVLSIVGASMLYLIPFGAFAFGNPLRFEPQLKPCSELYTGILLILFPLALIFGQTLSWQLLQF